MSKRINVIQMRGTDLIDGYYINHSDESLNEFLELWKTRYPNDEFDVIDVTEEYNKDVNDDGKPHSIPMEKNLNWKWDNGDI